MADARARLEWDQTAQQLAAFVNANRDPKKHPRPFPLSDFHPYLFKPPQRVIVPITALKVFLPPGS